MARANENLSASSVDAVRNTRNEGGDGNRKAAAAEERSAHGLFPSVVGSGKYPSVAGCLIISRRTWKIKRESSESVRAMLQDKTHHKEHKEHGGNTKKKNEAKGHAGSALFLLRCLSFVSLVLSVVRFLPSANLPQHIHHRDTPAAPLTRPE